VTSAAEPLPSLPTSDDDIARLVTDLDIPGLADVHVHFLPESVLRKVWAYFDDALTNYGSPWPITYRGDEEDRLGRLRSMGVRRFTSLVYAHRPGMSAWLNDWALEFAARTRGCVPTATFYPEDGVGDYVEDAIARGARVMKLHLQVGDFDPRDPLLASAWAACQDAGTVLVVHCASGPLPGRFTGPGPISEVLARFPRLRLVVAHLGLPEYAGFLDLAEAYDGVALDTTMAGTDYVESRWPFPADLRPRVRSLAREGKIVLGSDFPNIPYSYAHQLEVLPRLGIDDADLLARVLWHTGNEMLGAAP
jgi:predicted TIM-barrel fold metal-dependent hydrolase